MCRRCREESEFESCEAKSAVGSCCGAYTDEGSGKLGRLCFFPRIVGWLLRTVELRLHTEYDREIEYRDLAVSNLLRIREIPD